MGDYKIIAGVSSSLQKLLKDRMETTDPFEVTVAPPDVTLTGISARRVNLYLYQITENGYLKNQEIPGQGNPGAYGHPPLSLELHYLLTAYPSSETDTTGELDAQQILGDAMRVLHDFSIITPDLLDKTLQTILDPGLRSEFERVKVTLQPATMEDLTKVWSVLPNINFRRSVIYNVSVVQLESRALRRQPRPVKLRRVHVAPFKRPQILTIYRTPVNPDDPIGDSRAAVLDKITIEGLNFRSPKTLVKIGSLDPIQATPSSDTEIVLNVPDDLLLQPGPQLVEVLIQRESEYVEGGLDKGNVFPSQMLQHSNQSVFMLVPTIESINPLSGNSSTVLIVNGKRLFKAGLKSFVLVGDIAIEVRTQNGVPPTGTSVQVSLTTLKDLPKVAYPVRIIVNGALSTEEKSFTLTV